MQVKLDSRPSAYVPDAKVARVIEPVTPKYRSQNMKRRGYPPLRRKTAYLRCVVVPVESVGSFFCWPGA
jgi:hypothetical protein